LKRTTAVFDNKKILACLCFYRSRHCHLIRHIVQ